MNTLSDVFHVKQYVSVRVPFEEGNTAVKLSGIPPHFAHLAAIHGLNDEMTRIAPNLLNKFQTILDDRTFGGCLVRDKDGGII